MMAMEWIDGKSAATSNYVAKVRDAVDRLMYVFGDLRRDGIKLIDFDWAGIHDRASYQGQMNTVDIQWPEGVGPRQIMKMEHDVMLETFI
jgi:hypothetical protein